MIEQTYAEIYNTCSGSRDGLSGAISYSTIMDVAKSKSLTDYDDLLFYVGEVESNLAKNRAKDKK